MSNTNLEFVSTKVDLDRDIPGDEAFLNHHGIGRDNGTNI